MREQLIKNIACFLDNYEGIFLSEAEIQIKLAKYLIETNDYNDVFVEYYVNTEVIESYPWATEKIFIDIVVRKEKDYIPIEIKFKTKSQEFQQNVFGSQFSVELGEQKAHNVGRYSFWKDIKRIELIQDKFALSNPGVVLFITNDKKYIEKPKKKNKDALFLIHEDREITEGSSLDWEVSENRARKFPGFTLSKRYTINWKSMKINNHHYLLL
jgi:hypothetical protein